MDKLDFKTFDERFQNVPVKAGSEQSEIDNLRDEFIAKNSLTFLPTPVVPAEIKGKFLGNPNFLSLTCRPHCLHRQTSSHKKLVQKSQFLREKRLS